MNPASLLANIISDRFGVDQAFQVRENMVDETGEPLIGVSILLEGTSLGTVYDIEGNFSISFPSVSILPPFFLRNFAHQNRERHKSIVVESKHRYFRQV